MKLPTRQFQSEKSGSGSQVANQESAWVKWANHRRAVRPGYSPPLAVSSESDPCNENSLRDSGLQTMDRHRQTRRKWPPSLAAGKCLGVSSVCIAHTHIWAPDPTPPANEWSLLPKKKRVKFKQSNTILNYLKVRDKNEFGDWIACSLKIFLIVIVCSC